MQILIIGTGSIGSLFGSKLSLTGHEIFPYFSQKSGRTNQNNDINLKELDGTVQKIKGFYSVPPLDTFFSCSMDKLPQIVIIATKAYDLSQVCLDNKQLLARIPVIVLLQNGIGNERIIREHLPNSNLYRLLTSHGASLDEFGVVHHTGQGPTLLCDMISRQNKRNEMNESPDAIVRMFLEALTNAGFDPELITHPEESIWRKALVNIGINAIGALTRLSNGYLALKPGLKELVSQTVIETYNLGKKMKIPLLDQENYLQSVFSVIDATKNNKNSMLQDILKGNQTEIDFLNGEIMKLGVKIDFPTPMNFLLTHLIKGLEKEKKEKHEKPINKAFKNQ